MRIKSPKILYKRHKSVRYYECFYFGDHGSYLDHFPPLSRRYDVEIFGGDIEKILVRSCFECNSYLGSTMQSSLSERKKVALKRFKNLASKDVFFKEEKENERS